MVSSAAPSSSCQRPNPCHPRVAQVRISGVTTSAPEKSDSHHVRQTSANWSDGMTSPRRSDVGAEARADQGPHRGGRHQCEHVAHPFQARAHADQAAQEQGGDDHLERVADRLAEHRAHRRGVVADQEVPDHDAGPQPRPVEHERRDPDPDGRPQRRHRAVQVGQPQPDLRGAVVQRREEADRDAQQHEPPRARRAPRREVGIEPVLTGGDRAGDHGGRYEAIISHSGHRDRIWRRSPPGRPGPKH